MASGSSNTQETSSAAATGSAQAAAAGANPKEQKEQQQQPESAAAPPSVEHEGPSFSDLGVDRLFLVSTRVGNVGRVALTCKVRAAYRVQGKGGTGLVPFQKLKGRVQLARAFLCLKGRG